MIADTIAGLLQEGFARGYNVFSALSYVDDRLPPGAVIPEPEVSAVVSAITRRIHGVYDPAVWEVMLRMQLGDRIVPGTVPGRQEGAEAAMPGWAWALIAAAAGLMAVSVLRGGRSG